MILDSNVPLLRTYFLATFLSAMTECLAVLRWRAQSDWLKGADIMVGRQGSRRVTRMAVRDIQGGSPQLNLSGKGQHSRPRGTFPRRL